jgi:hypothetical protein
MALKKREEQNGVSTRWIEYGINRMHQNKQKHVARAGINKKIMKNGNRWRTAHGG